MKFNKGLLVLGASLLAFGSSYASSCPSEWPVAVKVSENQQIEITVQSQLIKNQKLTGGISLEISSPYTPLAEFRGQTLMGLFINSSKTEQWLAMGVVENSQKVSDGVCHQLQLVEGLSFKEVVKSHKASCYPLPSGMCGREKTSYLEMQLQGFSLLSLSSVGEL